MSKQDEVIKLNFGDYWPGCKNTEMKIKTIIWAQRYGMKIDKLPEEVQKKVREAENEQ